MNLLSLYMQLKNQIYTKCKWFGEDGPCLVINVGPMSKHSLFEFFETIHLQNCTIYWLRFTTCGLFNKKYVGIEEIFGAKKRLCQPGLCRCLDLKRRSGFFLPRLR